MFLIDNDDVHMQMTWKKKQNNNNPSGHEGESLIKSFKKGKKKRREKQSIVLSEHVRLQLQPSKFVLYIWCTYDFLFAADKNNKRWSRRRGDFLLFSQREIETTC